MKLAGSVRSWFMESRKHRMLRCAQLPRALKAGGSQESRLRSEFPAPCSLEDCDSMLTDAGFDLLSRLLEMDPSKRISAEEALQHEW